MLAPQRSHHFWRMSRWTLLHLACSLSFATPLFAAPPRAGEKAEDKPGERPIADPEGKEGVDRAVHDATSGKPPPAEDVAKCLIPLEPKSPEITTAPAPVLPTIDVKLLDASTSSPVQNSRLEEPPRLGRSFGRIFSGSYRKPTAKPLTFHEAALAITKRTCLKTFPWSEDEAAAIEQTHRLPSSAVVKKRIERVAQVLRDPERPDLDVHERALVKEVRSGRDPKLLSSWGEMFLNLTLLKERRYAEIVERTKSIRLDLDAKELAHDSDDASKGTYYRDDELKLISAATRARALLETSTLSVEEGMRLLDLAAYWKRLVDEKDGHAPGVLGADPAPDLLRFLESQGERSEDALFIRGRDRVHVATRSTASGKWELMDPERAGAYVEAHLRKLARTASDGTTDTWVAVPDGKGLRFLRGPAENDLSGPIKGLAAAWHGKETVIHVPKYLGDEVKKQVREVVNRAQRERPDLKVFVDDPATDARDRAHRAAAVHVDSSITAVVPSAKLGIIDGGAIQDLTGRLRGAGIDVRKFDGGEWVPTTGTLIVIAGHSSRELEEYVVALEKAGALRGNHVVFGACGTPLTVELRKRIHRAGAQSVFSFDKAITDENVQDLLDSLIRERQTKPNDGLVDHLIRWITNEKIDGVWEVSKAVGVRRSEWIALLKSNSRTTSIAS